MIRDHASKGDFNCIAMTMQMTTLPIMIWNAMTRVKLKSTGNGNGFLLSGHDYFSKYLNIAR
jgi:hypothetical protein